VKRSVKKNVKQIAKREKKTAIAVYAARSSGSSSSSS
jgi:hypothetical protein